MIQSKMIFKARVFRLQSKIFCLLGKFGLSESCRVNYSSRFSAPVITCSVLQCFVITFVSYRNIEVGLRLGFICPSSVWIVLRHYPFRCGETRVLEQMNSITKMLDEVQLQLQRDSDRKELEARLAPPPPPEVNQNLDEVDGAGLSSENDGDDESIGESSKISYRRHYQSLRRSTTSSLQRSNRRRLRWQSFYNDHQPSFRSRPIQLSSLSAGQVRITVNYHY